MTTRTHYSVLHSLTAALTPLLVSLACSSVSSDTAPLSNAGGSPRESAETAATDAAGGTAGNAVVGASQGGSTSSFAGSDAVTAGAGTAGTPEIGMAGAGGTPGALGVIGSLSFTRQTLHEFNYAEGIGIADFDNDGHVDVVSGPFWWKGPAFEKRHQYFPPPPDNEYTGMSLGDWADYAHDVDGDGFADTINIMRPGTPSYWYKNPGTPAVDAEESLWERRDIGTLVLEQSMLLDFTGEGKLNLLGAIDGHLGWFDLNADAPWAFNAVADSGVTLGFGWWHGIGAGDLDGDGKLDLLTDSGWHTRPAGDLRQGAWTKHVQRFKGDDVTEARGPSHMYGYDVDDDGDEDVITALDAHGYGIAWYENEAGQFTPHIIVGGADSMATNADMIAPFSQPHALLVSDIDGDGVKDIVTGKSFYAHPPSMGDPDTLGTPVFYVFKLIRGPEGVSWEPHLVDSEVGLGRQFSAQDLDGDGKVDIAVASKHGAFLFFQQ